MMVGITIVVVIYNDRFSVYRCLPKNDEGDRHFFLFLGGTVIRDFCVRQRRLSARPVCLAWPWLGKLGAGEDQSIDR